MKIGIIGAGKVGSAIAILLANTGMEVAGVASRSPQSAERLASRLGCLSLSKSEVARSADVLLITTSDDAIAQVAAELAATGPFHRGQVVLHMSGALTSGVLAPAAEMGAYTLSLHPVQSFASVEQALKLIPGTYFSIEGDQRGYDIAQEIVTRLGGQYFFLDSQAKVLYHAAAVEACSYLVGLLASSFELLAAAGVPEEVRLPAFLPLVAGTLENIKQLGIPGALTGPIARGDSGTLIKHLEAMHDLPEQLRVYICLGLRTVEVARAKGTISEEQAAALKDLLQKYENDRRKDLCLV